MLFRSEVIKVIAKKYFRFHLTRDEDADWDLCWQDGGIQTDQLVNMKAYKKINHFLGMNELSRKDHLGRNLMKMYKVLPEMYNFFPKTWLLPNEWLDFSSQFNGKSTFILKPEASCQGRGIFLTKKIEDIKPDQHYVGQQYISNPYLMDKLKFDIRIYVLLYGCEPLRIFIYKEGLVRLATKEYKKPVKKNISQVSMHLTNYAINKNSGKFIFNMDADHQDYGHKRNLASLWSYIDKIEGEGKSEEIKEKIEDIIIKTICSAQPIMAHLYKSFVPDDIDKSCCFEILGFDILLDTKLKPWLLEVNHSPSFATDTPLDWKIKSNLIADTFTLINMNYTKKKLYLQNKRRELKKRIFSKTSKDDFEQRQEYRDKKYRIRIKYELSHLGDYKLIYPREETKDKYQLCLEKSNEIYSEFICGTKRSDTIGRSLSIKQNDTCNIIGKHCIQNTDRFLKRPFTVRSGSRPIIISEDTKRSIINGSRTDLDELPKITDNFVEKIETESVTQQFKSPVNGFFLPRSNENLAKYFPSSNSNKNKQCVDKAVGEDTESAKMDFNFVHSYQSYREYPSSRTLDSHIPKNVPHIKKE